MKNLIITIFLASLFGSALAQRAGEIEKVNQTVVNFFEGFSKNNINIVKRYSTPDFLLLENAMIWNLDTIEQKLHVNQVRAIKITRSNSFQFIRTEIKGNTAWVAYHNTADFVIIDSKRQVNWLESAVLVKQGKEWKIQMMHSTPHKRKSE